MSDQKPRLQQKQTRPLLTAKNIKDIKMSVAGFGTMLFLMTHYAWIMRQWVSDPNLPHKTLIFYFIVFLANSVLTIRFLMNSIYPTIYAEELEQEALEKKASESKSE